MLKVIPAPFGEWRPDSADLNSPYLSIAKNVLPTATGYKRMGGFTATAGTLAAQAKGAAFGIDASATPYRFAGTQTKLYRAEADVSRSVGGNYAASSTDRWVFAQSGLQMVAVNPNDPPQVYSDITTSTTFAALGGSPPNATGVSQVGDFLFLWGLASNKRKLQWSAINDITGWTVGTNLSDEQTFPDLGNITGVYGDQSGFVLQQFGVRSLQFQPGDTTTIFRFAKVPGAAGCSSPYGWAVGQDGNVYYHSYRGFHSIGTSGYRNLGDNRVNKWFRDEAAYINQNRTECSPHASEPLIMWVFNNGTVTSSDYDRCIVYNYELDRFVHGDPSIEALFKYAYGVPAPYTSTQRGWFGYNTSHIFSDTDSGIAAAAPTLTGSEFEAIPGMKTHVPAIRPNVTLSELDNLDVVDSYRNTLEASPSTITASTADADGKFSFENGGVAARYHKITISAATTSAATTDRFTGAEMTARAAGRA